MRRVLAFSLAMLAIGALTGCQKYIGMTGAADARVWIMSQDATEIFRCYDLVPTGPGQSVSAIKPAVLCKRAKMVEQD